MYIYIILAFLSIKSISFLISIELAIRASFLQKSMPAHDFKSYERRILQPFLRREFLFTAVFAIFLGATTAYWGVSCLRQRKIKNEPETTLPLSMIFWKTLLVTRFFFGSIVVLLCNRNLGTTLLATCFSDLFTAGSFRTN